MKLNILFSIKYFTKSLLHANLRNYKALAVMMGVPVFMLLSFWLPSLASGPDEPDMMAIMFPTIVLLSVVIAGLTHATRLARWREQDVFRRLELTPVPLSYMIFGASLVQILMGLIQGLVMLVFGVFVLNLPLNWFGCLIAVGVMALAAATFIALGSFIAAITKKAEIAGYIFMFLLLPLIFLGSFPSDMMPAMMNSITPWLPTSMAIELIGVLFYSGHMPENAIFDFVGLFGYLLLFSILSTRNLRWRR
ncbi:MAG: ABC transporter permease [Anaerolineaceae bacterium]|nr:ABC transporter permease [Anaerolineaceae bacterium]